MANKLYNDTSVKAIADAIRAKNGTTNTYTVGEMATAITNLPTSQSVNNVITNYSIDNQAIKDFDDNVTYTSDYSTSQMGTYDHPTSYTKLGQPTGAIPNNIVAGDMILSDINMGTSWAHNVADNETIYNVSPNGVCQYKIISSGEVVAAGQLNPTGKVRTLYGTTLKNCRDLGGWACDGGTVKYGKLFRTSELTGLSRPDEQITALEKSMFINLLGIKCEVDLRDTAEQGGTATFDSSVEYLHQDIVAYKGAFDNDTRKAELKIVLTKIMTNAVENKPTFWHCVAGADRTGTVAWLLLGLLGVSQSDCDKEYEITCLSGPTRFRNKDYATLGYLSGLYNYISGLGKSTFRDNIIEAFRIVGIDECLVNSFRMSMIDGNPTTVSYDVPPMTITSNGTYDVSKVNQAIVNTPVPTGTLSISTNGEHNVAQYEKVNVNVQSGITPTGTINITANGTYDVTDKASAVVNVPIQAHSGSINIGSTTQQTISINLGFTGCKYFAIMSNANPVDTNTCDCMVWDGNTGYSAWSRYRGTYNQGYGADGGTVTVEGNTITITAGNNLWFSKGTTFTWIAK